MSDDPDDDRFLERAVAAGSQVLVSGDKHLPRLGACEGIESLPVAEFLDRCGIAPPVPWDRVA